MIARRGEKEFLVLTNVLPTTLVFTRGPCDSVTRAAPPASPSPRTVAATSRSKKSANPFTSLSFSASLESIEGCPPPPFISFFHRRVTCGWKYRSPSPAPLLQRWARSRRLLRLASLAQFGPPCQSSSRRLRRPRAGRPRHLASTSPVTAGPDLRAQPRLDPTRVLTSPAPARARPSFPSRTSPALIPRRPGRSRASVDKVPLREAKVAGSRCRH